MKKTPESIKFTKSETIFILGWSLLFFTTGFISLFVEDIISLFVEDIVVEDIPNIIIAICFALGATCVIYRFLGGLSGSSLTLKGLKLVGTAAFFGVATWFINSRLEHQRPVITPNPNTWTAIDKSGLMIPITIGGETYARDSTNFLAQAKWHITDNEDGSMWVSNSVGQLAQLDAASLSEIGYFNWIEMGQGIQYVDRLTVGAVENLSPIYPLKIKATAFRDEFNGFVVLDSNDTVIDRGTLQTRNFKMIEHHGNHYIILVRGAVHNDPSSEPWASFGVMQINLTAR